MDQNIWQKTFNKVMNLRLRLIMCEWKQIVAKGIAGKLTI